MHWTLVRKLTTDGFTFRPGAIFLAGTSLVPNQFKPTVTAIGGYLVESCSLGSIDHAIVWIGECTTVNSWRERENSYRYTEGKVTIISIAYRTSGM